MIKKAEKLPEISSLELQVGMVFTIWRKNEINQLTIHGENFEIIGERFKFKKGDEIHITEAKKIILRWADKEQTQVKFKIKRDGNFIVNTAKKRIRENVPQDELENDLLFEYNGVIFIHRFEAISDLREIINTTKDKVWEIV